MTPPVNNPGSAEPEPANERVQTALKEYLERIDRGEAVDREKFLSQRPEIATELRSFIDAEDELRKLAQLNERGSTSTQSFAMHGQETIAPQGGGRRSESGSGLKQQFGRYRIIKALGKGAMGMVYLAEDTQLLRQVALKTPHFEQEPTPDLLERFYREARAAANLRHPNICPVHDVGQIDGTHYISMAFIDGHSLSAFIRSKPQPERQILIVVRKLAQALGEAHERGIVHRDLKPANIMVDKRNEPIIMDFGLARQLTREDSVRITQSGMLIGTPAYMSPEQIEGEPDKVGPASDQFSLGVILYELLTGQLPFRGSLSSVMAQIITKDPAPPSQLRTDLDPRIEALCLKMLAREPANRFASLAAVAEEIAGILRNPGGRPTTSAATGNAATAKSAVATPPDPDVLASSARQSTVRKPPAGQTPLASLAAKDLDSLEELARKCLARHDYEQVVQIVGRIPQNKRTPALTQLLQTASKKSDEVAFLVVEIDEAVRFKDRATALKKADELLKIKPGHHRALKVQEQRAGQGDGGVRIIRQFTQPWRDGGWIPWSALAFGVAVFGVAFAAIVIWLNGTAVIIDSDIPGIGVTLNGDSVLITAPGSQTIKVWPGKKTLKLSYNGLEAITKEFTLKPAEKKTLVVRMAGSELTARFQDEIAPLLAEKADPLKNAGGTRTSGDENGTRKLADAGKEIASKSPVATPPVPTPPVTPSGPKPPALVSPFAEDAARAARAQWAGYLQQPGEFTNKIGMKLRLVPPGEFLMGSTNSKSDVHIEQKPQHRVHISHPFYIGAFEVTRGEFAKFVAATGYTTEAEKDGGKAAGVTAKGDLAETKNLSWKQPGFEQTDAHPVVIVSWNDATAFCRWLSEKDGQTYRLPSEAEWEYACRAGTLTPLISGSKLNDLFSVGNGLDATFRQHFDPLNKSKATDVRPADGFVFTAPVGSFRANAFGLCDMHGNVWEWCQDWYRAPYSPDEVTDPTGPTEGTHRVTRGGGFDCGMSTTSSARDFIKPSYRYANIGFRVVCDPAATPSTPEPPAVAVGSPPTPGFVSLFNGRDLTGWQKDPLQPGDWHVEGGVLTGGNPATAGCLYSDRADYKDFHLHVEARLTGEESGGVCIRTQFPASDAKSRLLTSGYEIILREPDDPKRPRTGTVYGLGSSETGEQTEIGFRRYEKIIEPGEWFAIDVLARGRHTEVTINGRLALSNNWIKKQYPPGRIALVQDRDKPSVQFRKIEISDLSTAAESATEKTTDKNTVTWSEFVPLFNGRDLSGWKMHERQPGGWRVENGWLIGDGPTRSHLYSERGDYRDFHVRVEAKINAGGNSGLFGRATFGPNWPLNNSQFPIGYEAQIYDGTGNAQTGSLYITDRGGPVVQVSQRLVPTDQWFTEELLVEGNHIIVKVNGKITADYQDAHPLEQGHIALQLHDPQTVITFRKIEIRELGQSSAKSAEPLTAPFDETAAKAGQLAWSEHLSVPVAITNSIGLRLQLIPPGTFRMGGKTRHDDSQFEHDVTITRPMYVGTYEVTRDEFTKFATASGYKTEAETTRGAWIVEDSTAKRAWRSSRDASFRDAGIPQTGDHPAVVITWTDAQAFCEWLSTKEGRKYRLPTEAEWEYFCRAGSDSRAYNGDETRTVVGNIADASASTKFPTWPATKNDDGFVYTSPVGKFQPNAFGLYDTIGNANEWCSDWYAKDYYENSPKQDPPGPAPDKTHVARGGSFTDKPYAADRYHFTPNHRAFNVGFRVVCEIPANAPQPRPVSTTATPTNSVSTNTASTTTAPPKRPPRRLWSGSHSSFLNHGGRTWRETIPDEKKVYSFTEAAKRSDYIELSDRTRFKGVRVRLFDDKAMIFIGGRDKDWRHLQDGHWEAPGR
jgi:formylglycine-generating enzyme required for sulfatase activity/serine/threonine protein kinase